MTTDPRTGLPAELFTTIDHVGIAVPDLDEALAFYAQAFGVHSVHEEVNEEQGVREAMLAVGDGDTRIQLLAPLTPESTIAKFIGRSGPGLQQLAFRVADVEAVSATLRERGLRPPYDIPRRGTWDSRVNFVHPKDAGGVLVELVEPAPTAHSRRTPPSSPLAGSGRASGRGHEPIDYPPVTSRATAPPQSRRRPGRPRERHQGRHPRRPAGRPRRAAGAGVLPGRAGPQGRAGHVRGPAPQGEGPAQVAEIGRAHV